MQRVNAYPGHLGPLRHSERLSIVGKEPIVPLVASLLHRVGPSAVGLSIVSHVVHSVKSHALWAFTHVRKELQKPIFVRGQKKAASGSDWNAPGFTHADASGPVSMVVGPVNTVTAVQHALPAYPRGAMAITRSGRIGTPLLWHDALTYFGAPSSDGTPRIGPSNPAFASAPPGRYATDIWSSPRNGQPSEREPAHVD